MRVNWRGHSSRYAATLALSIAFAQPAGAAEIIKGYVISYFVPAMYNVDDKDCPDGKNLEQSALMKQLLEKQGLSKAEIEKYTDPEYLNGGNWSGLAINRGRIDGKPVDVYLHPLSSKETLKLAVSKYGLGFNLDGKDGPGNFEDPFTHEKGVDNQLARIFGCYDRTRGTPEAMPGNATTIWRGGHLGFSWLIAVNGADNFKNADNVEVAIYRGLQSVTASATGDVQRNMTYTVDSDPRMQNKFHGKIRNGVFVADTPIDFFMVADMRVQGYFDFKQTHLQLAFKPDGSIEGYLGGYLPIKLVYSRYTQARGHGEYANGMSFPAVYQAMLRLADTDADKDPETGMRTRISGTYQITGVPEFLRLPEKKMPVAVLEQPRMTEIAAAN